MKTFSGLDLPLPFPTFGLMVAVAMLVCVSLSRSEVRRLHGAGAIGWAHVSGGKNNGGKGKLLPPQDIVGDLAVIVLLVGLVGARIFHILEYPQAFLGNPWGMIFTRGGFTFFGGLFAGVLAGVVFIKRKGLAQPPFADALAPALMLGYAIGRIGCQISGDGDWGIAADMALKPGWMPTWLWAQTYEHNIVGVNIAPPGVYPTPLYETLMALLAFALLWRLRRHRFQPGWLFSLYLVLAGIERLAIEQIRVNSVLTLFGVAVTQAQLIAGLLIVAGSCGLAWRGRRTAPRGAVA